MNPIFSATLLSIGVLGGLRAQSLPNLFAFPNAAGTLATYNAGRGPIDLASPFFQSLGTNGRSCGSCHRPAKVGAFRRPN